MVLLQPPSTHKPPSFRRRPEFSDDVAINTDISEWNKGLLDSGLRRNDGNDRLV